MREAAVLVFSYLVGAIPVGLIVGKLSRGIDIRNYGSGNIGATNVLRTLGPVPAAVVFVGDTAKGLAAVLLAKALVTGPHAPYLVIAAALLSVVGHSASPFLGFRGGKGVATSLGVFIGISPLIAVIAFGLWIVLVAAFRYVSVASIIASFSVSIQMLFSGHVYGKSTPYPYTAFALVAALLILFRHRSNIGRLLSGTEPKFGQKVKNEGG